MKVSMWRAATLGAAVVLGLGSAAAAAPAAQHVRGADTTQGTEGPTSVPTSDPGNGGAAPAIAGQTTVTLPLFGAPLTVDLATDASGALASVAVDPADGWTAVQDRPHHVEFVAADGTATVRVATHHGSESVAARGTQLSDISGPGRWAGDVFDTGSTTTVEFSVGAAADGGPDITDVTSSDPSAVVAPTQHRDGADARVARATVTFSAAGQRRVLSITATISTDGDSSRAALNVSLSPVRGVPQAPADAAGPHTWDGTLCDGTPVAVTYAVGADGTIADGAASGAPATIAHNGNHLDVRFDSGERLVLKVQHRGERIVIQVAQHWSCARTLPSVNTPTSITTRGTDGAGGDRRDGGDHGRPRPATATTAAPVTAAAVTAPPATAAAPAQTAPGRGHDGTSGRSGGDHGGDDGGDHGGRPGGGQGGHR